MQIGKESKLAVHSPLLNFSQLWRGRHDAGRRNSAIDGIDILQLLTSSQVALWKHNLADVKDLIGEVALAQYAVHKDSMKVIY